MLRTYSKISAQIFITWLF